MRIVIAPDKFKGSLTAVEAADAIARGWRSVPGPPTEFVAIPMADGGEGTVDVFVARGAQRRSVRVRGPLGGPVEAAFALTCDGVAVIEMAAASGLALVEPAARDVMRASSFGTGELLRAALDLAPARIIIGIGGSATNDGGAGMLRALGVRLLDRDGIALAEGAAALTDLASIDTTGLDPRIAETRIEVACDVDNPLLGPAGASSAYGPQKGASARQVAALDGALRTFADRTAIATGRDVRDAPGAGAAGGIGFALLAYLGAVIRPGVDVVADAAGLDAALDGAAVCITGEGRIDAQTLHGKTVAGVARRARAYGVPVVAFGGAIDASVEAALDADAGVVAFPIADGPMLLDVALTNAAALLEAAAARVARLSRRRALP